MRLINSAFAGGSFLIFEIAAYLTIFIFFSVKHQFYYLRILLFKISGEKNCVEI